MMYVFESSLQVFPFGITALLTSLPPLVKSSHLYLFLNVRNNNKLKANMKMMSSVVSMKLVGAIFVVLLLKILLFNWCGAVADAKHVGFIEKERHALLELKASLVLDDDTALLSSWDSTSDSCCAWEGITCSNQTGHVERLDLNGFQFRPFRGEINVSLTEELRHLKYLNLRNNLFSNGNIPELFGSLRNLKSLDLHESFHWGRIPNDLVRLSHLQYLDLSYNDLEGTIPHQLGNLSHLQQLDLHGNHLAGAIPRRIGNLSHLQYLDLSMNILVGTIPHQLGSLLFFIALFLHGSHVQVSDRIQLQLIIYAVAYCFLWQKRFEHVEPA